MQRLQFEKEYQANEISKRKRKGNRTISIRKILGSALDMLKNYGEILKMRTIRIIATSIFYLIAYAVFCANRMYFFTYNMELSAGKITFIMSLMTFASVAFVPVILAASRRFDKRTLYLIGMGICAAVMGIFGFTGVFSMAAVSLFSIAYCIGSICYWQLVPAMIYDVCEVDQLINICRISGGCSEPEPGNSFLDQYVFYHHSCDFHAAVNAYDGALSSNKRYVQSRSGCFKAEAKRGNGPYGAVQ